MRFLVKITVPHELFNSAVKNGSIGARTQAILAEIEPEAAYFTEFNGKRTAILVVNFDDVSQLTAIGEPWFLNFKADVEFHPAMTGADLAKGNLEALRQKWN